MFAPPSSQTAPHVWSRCSPSLICCADCRFADVLTLFPRSRSSRHSPSSVSLRTSTHDASRQVSLHMRLPSERATQLGNLPESQLAILKKIVQPFQIPFLNHVFAMNATSMFVHRISDMVSYYLRRYLVKALAQLARFLPIGCSASGLALCISGLFSNDLGSSLWARKGLR